MIAILLVGGLGTRLRPLTLRQPKALLPVLNQPFITYQLNLLKGAGVRSVVLSAGRPFKRWSAEVRRLIPKGMKADFAFEPEPLGTGGGIRFGYERIRKKRGGTDAPVIVFNGDVLFDFDLRKLALFHSRKKSSCTIGLIKVDDPSRFGVVGTDSDQRIHRFVEKPKNYKGEAFVNAGVYVLQSSLIETIPIDKVVSIERDSFPLFLKRKERMFGYRIGGYWNDIGTHLTFLQAHRDLLGWRRDWTAPYFLRKSSYPMGPRKSGPAAVSKKPRVLVGRKSRMGRGVSMEGFVCCGSKVSIADQCRIRDSVILDGVQIGIGVKISNAIIGPDCRIGDFSEITEGAVLGPGTTLAPYTKC